MPISAAGRLEREQRVTGKNEGAAPAEVFPELTRDVIDRMRGAESARLREVMAIVVRHLHAIVREAQLTQGEWWQAIDFLTHAGKMCSDSRQELILLSDILGVSMLVDAVDNVAGPGISDSTVLGPFYAGHQRELAHGDSILLREEASEPLVMSGRVTDPEGKPIAGALVEVWQTAPNQRYDVQDSNQPQGHLRASFRTDTAGAYRFRTILPVSYPIPDNGPAGQLLAAMGRHPFRPAHVHFMISAPGYRTLVTHLFFEGDEYLESDAVFGVKPSLVVRPESKGGINGVEYDFGLGRELHAGSARPESFVAANNEKSAQ
jgi:protocatechuate 3,4-dioxygenase beta subunit